MLCPYQTGRKLKALSQYIPQLEYRQIHRDHQRTYNPANHYHQQRLQRLCQRIGELIGLLFVPKRQLVQQDIERAGLFSHPH
ncbi:Uncharacterised protein [Serratia fonticola]|uniref:Uncharacterized protein n=1 Tax=Serratia fonticola TaxID=47917 RepID=A0A4U9UET5_SERFO|nr:Uncharacterised protein [Serratia fonticola]